ncbi:hypothetical protein Q9966_004043 [Columba livia]|nr:hypothetical protein Q9966_004043 [Columba livia]
MFGMRSQTSEKIQRKWGETGGWDPPSLQVPAESHLSEVGVEMGKSSDNFKQLSLEQQRN